MYLFNYIIYILIKQTCVYRYNISLIGGYYWMDLAKYFFNVKNNRIEN